MWLWVYHNKIPVYPIFYLLKGDIYIYVYIHIYTFMYVYIYIYLCARMGEHLLLGGCVVYYEPCALSNLVVSIPCVFPTLCPTLNPKPFWGGGVLFI